MKCLRFRSPFIYLAWVISFPHLLQWTQNNSLEGKDLEDLEDLEAEDSWDLEADIVVNTTTILVLLGISKFYLKQGYLAQVWLRFYFRSEIPTSEARQGTCKINKKNVKEKKQRSHHP